MVRPTLPPLTPHPGPCPSSLCARVLPCPRSPTLAILLLGCLRHRYETLRLCTWLPALELAPQLVLSVWDRDEGIADSDDFVGSCRLPLVPPGHAHGERAEWVPIRTTQGRCSEPSGEVLVRVELVPLPIACLVGTPRRRLWEGPGGGSQMDDVAPTDAEPATLPALREDDEHPPADLTPASKSATVTLLVLGVSGLRHLKPTFGMTAPSRPFVQLDIGRRKGKKGSGVGAATRRTSTSNRPSASNPLFREVLELQPLLPTNRGFLPPLNVCVHDSLFGGLRTPLIGSTVVHLGQRLPATFFEADGGGGSGTRPPARLSIVKGDDTVVDEAWENQRWSTADGWQPTSAGAATNGDPPPFSTERPPFVLPEFAPHTAAAPDAKDAKSIEATRARELDERDHELRAAWTLFEWSVAETSDANADGWEYAVDFCAPGAAQLFGEAGPQKFVRRRKWGRRRSHKVHRKTREMLEAQDVLETRNADARRQRQESHAKLQSSKSSKKLTAAEAPRVQDEPAATAVELEPASEQPTAALLGATRASNKVASARESGESPMGRPLKTVQLNLEADVLDSPGRPGGGATAAGSAASAAAADDGAPVDLSPEGMSLEKIDEIEAKLAYKRGQRQRVQSDIKNRRGDEVALGLKKTKIDKEIEELEGDLRILRNEFDGPPDQDGAEKVGPFERCASRLDASRRTRTLTRTRTRTRHAPRRKCLPPPAPPPHV